MDRIIVGLEGRPYDVLIGQGLIGKAGALLAPFARDERLLIVTDTHVGQHVLPRFAASLQEAGLGYAAHLLPAGEGAKSWAELERLVDWLLSEHVERSDNIVALGGGVVGDLAGSYNAFGIRRWFERPRQQLAGRSPRAELGADWSVDDATAAQVKSLAQALVGANPLAA